MCEVHLVVGESQPKGFAKPYVQKLIDALGLHIKLADVSDWSDTDVRCTFVGKDIPLFAAIMQDAKSYIYDNEQHQEAFEDLGRCALSNSKLQDDGSLVATFDAEFFEGVKTWRNATEQDVINQFEEMLQECEFYVDGNRVRFIKDYKDLDEIACEQHFNDWVDSLIADGTLPDLAENYSV